MRGTSSVTQEAMTFRFAQGRPLFNLADGDTVNSVQAGITNNQWVLLKACRSLPAAVVGLGLVMVSRAARRSESARSLPTVGSKYGS